MAKDWTQDETIKQLEIEIERKDAEIERLRKDNFKMWTILCDKPYGEIAHKAANEIERLREALREISCTCDTHCRFDGFELCDQWVARAALKEGE